MECICVCGDRWSEDPLGQEEMNVDAFMQSAQKQPMGGCRTWPGVTTQWYKSLTLFLCAWTEGLQAPLSNEEDFKSFCKPIQHVGHNRSQWGKCHHWSQRDPPHCGLDQPWLGPLGGSSQVLNHPGTLVNSHWCITRIAYIFQTNILHVGPLIHIHFQYLVCVVGEVCVYIYIHIYIQSKTWSKI